MKLFDRVAKYFGYAKVAVRDFAGALSSRLTNDWLANITTADSEIRSNIKTLRARCRELERNNDWVRRYFKLLENNVLGHCGVGLQMKIRETVKVNGQFAERYDKRANDLIEMAWEKWGRREFCTIGQNLNWLDVQRIALRSVARDGCVLIRMHNPPDNPFRFALELIEADQLDTDWSGKYGDNNVRLGVEYDANGRRVAYHILSEHPGDIFQRRADGMYRRRIPASEMIHLYMPERVGQSDGFPWLVSAMTGLRHLEKFTEAAVVNARMGAAKMGFITQDQNSPGYTGAPAAAGKYMEVEPGNIEVLPVGMKFEKFDPTYPSSDFAPFTKAALRQISSGLGVSYNSLSNDLESVNYSSIRAGLLEEREEWKSVQSWFIQWFICRVFENWLRMSLTAGAIGDGNFSLPAQKFDKFNAPEFKPRRWPWVDPLSDLQADVLAVEKGFKSRRELISERGGDIEDVFSDIAADDALAEQYDLDFDADSGEQANQQPDTPDAPDDPESALTTPKD